MIIRTDERCLFLGRTGSGKTHLAKHIIKSMDRWIFVDPKHENSDMNGVLVKDAAQFKKALGSKKVTKILFQPNIFDETTIEECCKEIFKKGNRLVYFDEIAYDGFKTGGDSWFRKLLRMGRSRNIGVWCSTQRPSWIDNYVISESEHFFIFKFKHPADTKKFEGVLGKEHISEIGKLERYNFAYYGVIDDAFDVFSPV